MREARLDRLGKPAIRLRAMTCGDVADGVALLAQLGYVMTADTAAGRMRDVLSTPDHRLLLAEIEGRIVGLMHVFLRPAVENPREAVVQALVVDEGCRRAGVGRALMAEAERWGREWNCCSVVLGSNIARAPAHAFYAALGYNAAATAYVLRKSLSPR
jgi:GNAT superfamily N-acetyltransferase